LRSELGHVPFYNGAAMLQLPTTAAAPGPVITIVPGTAEGQLTTNSQEHIVSLLIFRNGGKRAPASASDNNTVLVHFAFQELLLTWQINIEPRGTTGIPRKRDADGRRL
jgi:hypothetical protein